MLDVIYQQMLTEFGDTLEKTSEDNGTFMTASQKKVVNFDEFKSSVAAKYGVRNTPNSCDALYMHARNEWFLIEFKNGKLNQRDIYQLRGKILQSLLLLTEKLKKTILFTRANLDFILVYNRNKKHSARIHTGYCLNKLAKTKFFPFGLDGLEKLYLKEVNVWTEEEFDTNFVEKYGCK
jgi:hypothetical protein